MATENQEWTFLCPFCMKFGADELEELWIHYRSCQILEDDWNKANG